VGASSAAHTRTVSAGSIIAPAFCSGFGRIVKNPAAAGIRARLDSLCAAILQHFSQGSGNPRDHPVPTALQRNQLCSKPILVLDEPLTSRYLQRAVKFGELGPAEGASGGEFFGGTAQKGTQAQKFPAWNLLWETGVQFPMLQESG